MRLALSNVNEFVISPGILEKTLVSLREYGARRLECLVLWLGNVEESRALVTGVLVLAGVHLERGWCWLFCQHANAISPQQGAQ